MLQFFCDIQSVFDNHDLFDAKGNLKHQGVRIPLNESGEIIQIDKREDLEKLIASWRDRYRE